MNRLYPLVEVGGGGGGGGDEGTVFRFGGGGDIIRGDNLHYDTSMILELL